MNWLAARVTRLPFTIYNSTDDIHLVHYGKGFDEIAILWDPVSESYVPAHNLVKLHYSDDQTDYPIAYQLWRPADLVKIENGLQSLGIKLRADKVRTQSECSRQVASIYIGSSKRNIQVRMQAFSNAGSGADPTLENAPSTVTYMLCMFLLPLLTQNGADSAAQP